MDNNNNNTMRVKNPDAVAMGRIRSAKKAAASAANAKLGGRPVIKDKEAK